MEFECGSMWEHIYKQADLYLFFSLQSAHIVLSWIFTITVFYTPIVKSSPGKVDVFL
jgi:hypothetical protein